MGKGPRNPHRRAQERQRISYYVGMEVWTLSGDGTVWAWKVLAIRWDRRQQLLCERKAERGPVAWEIDGWGTEKRQWATDDVTLPPTTPEAIEAFLVGKNEQDRLARRLAEIEAVLNGR